MATRDIVPNGNNEGSLGTDVRRWAGGHFEVLKKAGQDVSVEGHKHTAADILDFEEAVNEAVSLGTNDNASLLTQGTLPDERLSSAVQTSLGKADTASQPGHEHTAADITDGLYVFGERLHAADHRHGEADEILAEALTISTNQTEYAGAYFSDGTEIDGRPVFYKPGTDKAIRVEYSTSESRWKLFNGVTQIRYGALNALRPWGGGWVGIGAINFFYVTQLSLERLAQLALGTSLPLSGGTLEAGAQIAFANGSKLKEGTTDAGLGGNGGIALKCSVDYELKWDAGRLFVMEQDGFLIRSVLFCGSVSPTADDDTTKGFYEDSLWVLDNGTTYKCVDASEGAAVWQKEPANVHPDALLGTRYKGDYDNGADYNPGDVVSYSGGLYVRIGEPNPGYFPGTEYWDMWSLSKSDLGLGNVDNTADANKPISTAVQDALDSKADLVDGKVPSTQLPSYVDDVIEVANEAARPATGETGKIYVTLNNNKCWRWSGSAYVEISPSPGSTDSVPEGSTNLYHTTARAAAAAPVQSVAGRSGNVTLQKSDVGLSNVDNTSDVSKPISTATQSALNLKVDSTDARLTDARFQSLLSRVAWVYDAVNYQIASETTSLAGRTDGATTPTITPYNQNGGVGNGHVYRFNIAATSPTNTPRQCSDICVLRSAFTNTAPFFMQSNVARGVIEYSRPFAVSFRVAGPNIAFGEFFFGIGYAVPSLSNAAGATIPDLPDKGFGLRLQRNTSVSNTWNASAFYRTSSAASQTFTSLVTVSPVSNVYQFVLYWTGSGLEVYQYNGSTLTSVTSFTGVNLGTSAANNVNWLMGVAPLNSAGQMQYDVQPPVITWF